MPAYPSDTLDSDLAAIFGAGQVAPAREADSWAKHVAIALAVFAVLAFALLHRMPGPQAAPMIAAHPAFDRPAASAYVAAPAVPTLPDWAPAPATPPLTVAESAPPRAVAAPRQKTIKATRPERQFAIAALPTRDRLTLAQGIPSEEQRNNEGTLTPVDLGRIQIRAARLEAVDAIRTLRLR